MHGGEILGSLSHGATMSGQRENVIRLRRCFFVGLVLWPLFTPVDLVAAQQGASLPALLGVRAALPLLLLAFLAALKKGVSPGAVTAMEIIAFSCGSGLLGLDALIAQGFRTPTFTSTFLVLVVQGLLLPSPWQRGLWRTAPTLVLPPLFLVVSYVVRPELRTDFDDPLLRAESVSYVVAYFAAWVVVLIAGDTTWNLRRQVHQNQLIGRYRLIEKIGQGGMGEVWKAFHPTLKTEVAMKLTTHNGPTELQRFEREIEVLTAITHPGVVKIFDCGMTDEGLIFYTMELLQGRSLKDRMAEGGLSLLEIGDVISQVAGALHEVHAHGIIHRDIKPENIVLVARPEGGVQAKLIDFGIAKQQGLGPAPTLTMTGSVLGTPVFLAPEQALGENVDARTDVYALGAVLFACLTGRPPFLEDSLTAMLLAHAQKAAPAPSFFVAGLPPGVDEVVLRCLRKHPADRYPSAKEMGEAVLAVLSSPEALGAQLSPARWDSDTLDVPRH